MPTRFQIASAANKAQQLAQEDPAALAKAFIGRCPSLWAEAERKIKGEPFTFKGREYWIEPHDIQAPKIVVETGSQMGKTNFWMNREFHDALYRGRSCFVLFPTGGAASDFSSGKFKDAIESSEQLSAFFTDIDNVGHKRAGPIEFFIRSSSSRRGAMLQVVTADNVVVDEIDRCEEGSVEQALHRRAGVEEKGLIMVSTPTLPGSGIDYEYGRSDMRLYMVRCLACNTPQALEFAKNIEWNATIKNERERWDSARHVCASCRKPWTRPGLREMVAGGEWVAHQPGRDSVGYGGLGQIYSPTIHPPEMVQAWEDAEGNETKRAIFIRFCDGKSYASSDIMLSEKDVRGAVGNYEMQSDSKNGAFLGLDVGPPHWALVAEYPEGPEGRMRIIWMGKLDRLEEADALMHKFSITLAVVDAAPEREKANEFCSRNLGRAYQAFYPWDAKMKATAAWEEKDWTVRLHRTFWIDRVIGRFPKATISFPKDASPAQLKHFQNIARIEEPDEHGNLVARWIEARAGLPDHMVHAAVYADAAAAKAGRPFKWDLEPDPSFERGSDELEFDLDWEEGY